MREGGGRGLCHARDPDRLDCPHVSPMADPLPHPHHPWPHPHHKWQLLGHIAYKDGSDGQSYLWKDDEQIHFDRAYADWDNPEATLPSPSPSPTPGRRLSRASRRLQSPCSPSPRVKSGRWATSRTGSELAASLAPSAASEPPALLRRSSSLQRMREQVVLSRWVEP